MAKQKHVSVPELVRHYLLALLHRRSRSGLDSLGDGLGLNQASDSHRSLFPHANSWIWFFGRASKMIFLSSKLILLFIVTYNVDGLWHYNLFV
ncbi:hypothetical protein K449DRAFT_388695 [Hypoxylon sp. EC38]|nr:hypothetical protein K449DRAFT_388695 [Hypoxylon sp. EC38]